ncbi:MAG: M1 family aminopeptidase, partial [Gemmatimonadota bacterium]|nr:M1 family aminopeptidase [Gemmatimonadota bacterium]
MAGWRRGAVAAAVAASAALPAAGCGVIPGEPSVAELTEEGVTRTLAEWRAARVDSLRYRLAFRLPAERSAPVEGVARITWRRTRGEGPVILDFAAPDSAVRGVESRGRPVEWELRGGHLVVPAGAAVDSAGAVSLEVAFVAGDGPLNRNEEYLYTLFVPARAREAFPCFDQPDLKGRFRLSLEAPEGWRVVSNTPAAGPAPDDPPPFGPPGPGRRLHRFAETPPLPTYLFAFAAGRFQVEAAERDGRTLRMLHRETDAEKVRRNREAAFDLHAAALRWLEEYTGIPYPFEKFEFVLVPSFQYGGMEHPGAVLYRASRVLLDESPTTGQKLGRASLISHETAHMWFGDLVTMEWFDDVWMKEVFANFMAAKIVHPSFPEIDHDLRFLLNHHPSAYAVDRSEGTHPIRQELPNLADAGSLYGAIIYQKAPIVMRQLEALTGEDAFREGVRDYLRSAPWGNAGWPGLVAALDPHTELDVAAWSRVWVEEANRPAVEARTVVSGGRIDSLVVEQRDPTGRGRRWPQRIETALGTGDSLALLPVRLRGRSTVVEGARGRPAPDFVVPGAGGRGYGRFVLDPADRDRLLEALPGIEPAVSRAAAWLILWDAMLEGEVAPGELVELVRDAVGGESEELLVERMLADLSEAWWRYLDAGTRRRLAPGVERSL